MYHDPIKSGSCTKALYMSFFSSDVPCATNGSWFLTEAAQLRISEAGTAFWLAICSAVNSVP